MNEEETAPVEHGDTFLEMLYHYEEQQTIPVVDEDFVRRFSGLSEENQYKAMEHISRLSGCHGVGLRGEVYQTRLVELYKGWFQDQTETWVCHTYEAPIDKLYWEHEEQRTREFRAQRRAEEGLVPAEGMQETISLVDVKKELGLV